MYCLGPRRSRNPLNDRFPETHFPREDFKRQEQKLGKKKQKNKTNEIRKAQCRPRYIKNTREGAQVRNPSPSPERPTNLESSLNGIRESHKNSPVESFFASRVRCSFGFPEFCRIRLAFRYPVILFHRAAFAAGISRPSRATNTRFHKVPCLPHAWDRGRNLT